MTLLSLLLYSNSWMNMIVLRCIMSSMNTLFSPMLSKQNGGIRPYYFFLAAIMANMSGEQHYLQFLLDQKMVLNPAINISEKFWRIKFC